MKLFHRPIKKAVVTRYTRMESLRIGGELDRAVVPPIRGCWPRSVEMISMKWIHLEQCGIFSNLGIILIDSSFYFSMRE